MKFKLLLTLTALSVTPLLPVAAYAHHSDETEQSADHHKHHQKDQKQKQVKLRHETSESIDEKIKDGVTTKAEIKALFGTPQNIDFNEQTNNEKWIYAQTSSHLTAGGWIGAATIGDIPGVDSSTSNSHQLTILFKGDKVAHHFFTAGKASGGAFTGSHSNS